MTGWILLEAELLLRAADYSTLHLATADRLAFEDDEVLGFCSIYPTTPDLLQSWSKHQDELLGSFAAVLRRAGRKAWNVYFVALTEGPASEGEQYSLDQIEADLTQTRKIVRAGIRLPVDVKAAMAPLLPIHSDAQLASERLEDRLSRKLESELGADVTSAILGTADELVVAQTMIESSR